MAKKEETKADDFIKNDIIRLQERIHFIEININKICDRLGLDYIGGNND